MTLVSNTEQTTTENVSPGANKWAMSFTTGSQAQGYTVSNVTLDIASVASGYAVSNFSASIWTSVHRGLGIFLPASRLVTLDNPDSLSAGLNSFTPSSQTTLAQDTMYFVVVDDGSGSDVALKRTTSTAEDPGSAAGWSIGDKRVYVPRNNTWSFANLGSHLFQFQVNGATVSGEAVNYAATGQPAITGTAQVGQVLTADLSGIADANGTTQADNDAVGYAYTYQWVQVATDGTETDITGATAGTYTLATEDAGKTVKVTVSFTDDADNDEGPLVSEAYPATGTIALADGNHPATGVPAITGPAQVGQVLTADLSGIADEDGTTQADNDAVGYAYTYQWVQVATDGTDTDIAGATASTYTLATEDAGKTVKVTVSFTDDADNDEGPLTSEPYPATGTIAARNATIALVSNTGQPLGFTTYLLGGLGKRYAQEFRTGANAGGYHLDTVGVYVDTISSSPRASFTVHVYTAAANGTFDTLEYTLRSPNSYTDSAVNVFTAPDGAVLAANTDYQIVFDATGRNNIDDARLPTTTSNAEDPGSAAGWSIKNVSRLDGNSRGPKFLISVRGRAVVESAATGQPSITGTAQVGQVLTAGKGTIADENGTTKADNDDTNYAYTYQWVRVATDSTEMDITGATSKTYTLAAEDAGLTVKVKVSFTDDANFDEGPLTSEPYPATGTIALADGNHPATGVPTITGTARVGQTLTADLTGIADEDGTTQADNSDTGYAYTYQWIRVDGESETEIISATSKTYTLTADDVSKTVKVSVSFVDDADFDEGPLESAAYPATGTIAGADGNHAATGQPAITGTAQAGEVLTADLTGLADEDGTTQADNDAVGFAYTYQWVQVDGSSETDIAGATSKTYTLAADDVGKTVKVKVSFTDDADNDEGPLTSAEYPSSGTVVAACPTGDLWCGGLLVGAPGGATSPEGYCSGYCLSLAEGRYGGLSDRDFHYDSTNSPLHKILSIRWATGDLLYSNGPISGPEVIMVVTPNLAGGWATDVQDLQLQIGGTTFDFSDASVEYCCGHPTDDMRIAWAADERPWPTPGIGTTARARLIRKTDAALNDLAVVDQNAIPVDLTPAFEESFEFSPGFSPGTKRYTATVADTVESIVVTATPAQADATVEYVGSMDIDRVDKDPETPELEASLRVGLNRVQVKVTRGAESSTYVIKVLRRDAPSSQARGTEDAEKPLTAEFKKMPGSHDGNAFTFRIKFSAEVTIGRVSMRDHALTVRGGQVTAARRVDGRNDLWEITVTPDDENSVSIEVPPQQACGKAGALCTAEGQSLSTGLLRMIPGPSSRDSRSVGRAAPLKAKFSGVPAEHDGENAFSFTLTFSEDVDGLSYKTLRNSAFEVTGGSVTKAKRVTERSNQGWAITVKPKDHGAVTIVLPETTDCAAAGAICATEGRKLSNESRARVEGPPGLSVADAEVEEGADATLEFAVKLSRAASGTVTVDYATSDVTAEAGLDYEQTEGTLTFEPDETRKWIEVRVLDDDHDEGVETMTLTLSNPSSAAVLVDATATGTITNSDPMPQAWLARFGRAAADGTVESIGRRMRGEAQGTYLRLGGGGLKRLRSWTGGLIESAAPDPARQGLSDDARLADETRWERMDRLRAESLAGGARNGEAYGLAGGGLTGAGPAGHGTVENAASPHGSAALDDRAAHSHDVTGTGNNVREFARLLGVPRLRDLVMGSSFVYTPGPDTEIGPSWLGAWSAWGETGESRFSGSEQALKIEGELATATFGIDSRWERWLAGVALSYNEAEGTYAGGGGESAVNSSLASVNPYARYELNDRTGVWGVLGYGIGELTLAPAGDGVGIDTGLSHSMIAFGGRTALSVRTGDVGRFEMAVRSDARTTRTASKTVVGLMGAQGVTSRVRLMLEGSGSLPLWAGSALSTTLEAGLRYDGGDAETGAGLEIGGGLGYSAGRLTVQVNARGLLAHEAAEYEEWGFSGSVAYRPRPDGRGLNVRLGSVWGAAQSGVSGLWTRETARGLARSSPMAASQRLQAEFGYGVNGPKGRALWAPFLRAESAAQGPPSLQMGIRLTSGARAEAGLVIVPRENTRGELSYDMQLDGQIRW